MIDAGKAFPRQYRLTNKVDFDKVFHRGNRVKGELFTAVVLTNELDRPRLGMAVSRRSAGTAIARNRLKRQIRESFRTVRATLGNVDVVVLVSPQAAATSRATCRENLSRLWDEVNQQCARSASR